MRWIVVAVAVPAWFSKPPPITEDYSNYNVAFVTSETFRPSELVTVDEADRKCMAAATTAHLPDATYIAWVSTDGMNAVDRLSGSRGWIRTDGKPIADLPADLAAGRLLYPIRWTETPDDVVDTGMTSVYTNTQDGSSASGDCIAHPDGFATYGAADAEVGSWSSRASDEPCTLSKRLYCMGVGKTRSIADLPPGRLAFISFERVVPNLVAMDATCQADGPIGTGAIYKAFVATNGEPARARFTVFETPRVRRDGVEISADLTSFEAPLVIDSNHMYSSEPVFTGAQKVSEPGTLATTCANWTSTSAADAAIVGDPSRSNDKAFGAVTGTCDMPHRVYCVEDQ